MHGSGIRAWGLWGPRRAGLGWVEVVPGAGESFSGLEVDGTGVAPVGVLEDGGGGEESEGESTPEEGKHKGVLHNCVNRNERMIQKQSVTNQ